MKRGPFDDDDVRDSRRKLLAALAASAAGAIAGCARAVAAPSAQPAASGHRRKWGLVIDLDRCARCAGCVVACQQENNVAPAGPRVAARTRPIHWMDFLPPAPGSWAATPIPCMHCEDPPCVKVCPVGATYQSDEGITAQIWERCIGCRYCMVACPYARRYFNWSEPGWQDQVASLNPDVAPRPRGVVEKCTLCHHRIRAAIERARLDEEPLSDEILRRLPACAQSCPTQAISFGDLADPASEVARLAASPRAMRLLPEAGTRPKVIYLRESK
jgi:molybdopterin-containing oxidoreductase family iron-sulfur binding subunit